MDRKVPVTGPCLSEVEVLKYMNYILLIVSNTHHRILTHVRDLISTIQATISKQLLVLFLPWIYNKWIETRRRGTVVTKRLMQFHLNIARKFTIKTSQDKNLGKLKFYKESNKMTKIEWVLSFWYLLQWITYAGRSLAIKLSLL